MDFRPMLDTQYDIFGVEVDIEQGTEVLATVTVIDKTAGVEVMTGEMGVNTIKPAAAVRVYELADWGVTDMDLLVGCNILLNGTLWEVNNYLRRPTPNGEANGEVYLLLMAAGNA